MRFTSILFPLGLAFSTVYGAKKSKNDENWIEAFDDTECKGTPVEGKWNDKNYNLGEGARSIRLNLKAPERKVDYYFGHPYACDEQPTIKQYGRGHPIWSLETYKSFENNLEWPKPERSHDIDFKDSDDRRCYGTHNVDWNDNLKCLRLKHYG